MKFLIRTDAYEDIGTGHLMRCLALAQGIKNHGDEVVFITYCKSEELADRLLKEGFVIHVLTKIGNINDTFAILNEENPQWVILDGYHFDTAYQKAIKGAGYKCCVVDDYAHLDHYYADIIINQDYGAKRFTYKTEPYTRLLLGPEYIFLRREFLEFGDYTRELPEKADKILITLGGGDAENHTLKILRAMNLINFPLTVRIIVGAVNPHYESVLREAKKSRHAVGIFRAAQDMARMMAWADVAVSAGGTTVWELAYMGLPALLCVVAENQRYCVEVLDEDGIFKSAAWLSSRSSKDISDMLTEIIHDRNLREAMSKKERRLVDGKGVVRTLQEITRIERIGC